MSTLWPLLLLHLPLLLPTQARPQPESPSSRPTARSYFAPVHRFLLGLVGGSRVDDNEWPATVSLQYSGRAHFCGGVVWNANYILTAAHCFYTENGTEVLPTKIFVYVGHADITFADQRFMFASSELIPHDKYLPKSVEKGNDLGLIKLDRPIDFAGDNQGVQCACQPDHSDQVLRDQCYVVGWGKTMAHKKVREHIFKLREVRVPLLDDAYCKERSLKRAYDDTNQMCAGYKSGGKDACQGDSGGPLWCAVSKEPTYVYELTGVVSYGKSCGSPDNPGFYTKVAFYRSWIKEKTGC